MKRKFVSVMLILIILLMNTMPVFADDGINYLSPSGTMQRYLVNESVFANAISGTGGRGAIYTAPDSFSIGCYAYYSGQNSFNFKFESTAIRIITTTYQQGVKARYTVYLDDVAVLNGIPVLSDRKASSMYYVSGLSSGIHSIRIKNIEAPADLALLVMVEAIDLNVGGIVHPYEALAGPPTTPIGLALASQTLSWTANASTENVSSYHIFDNNVLIGTTASTSYVLSGLTNGIHAISISALSATGESPKTTSITYDNSLPSTPTGVNVTGSGGSGTLSWSANPSVDNVTSYKVFDNGTLLNSTTSTSYDFTSFGVGSHSLTVSAVNANGESPKTSGVSYIVLAPPSKINGLIATGSGASSGIITWASSPVSENVTSYSVYDNSVILATPTTNSYAFSGLGLGLHTFQVSATNELGEGIKSDVLNYTVIPPPSSVTLEYTGVTSSSVKLTWNSLGTGVNYTIYKSIDGQAYQVEKTADEASFSTVVSALTYNRDYWFKVTASNVAGSGGDSNIVNCKTLNVQLPTIPILSVSDVTTSSATLSWQSYPESTYCIYDQNGNKLKELSGTTYNLSGLGSDMDFQYYLTVVNSAGESQKGSVSFRTLSKEPFSFVGQLIDLGMSGQGILSGLVLFFKSTWYLVVLLIVVPVSIWLAKTLVRLGVVDKNE